MQMETVTEDTPMGGNGRKIALEGGFFYKEQELGLVTAWIPPPPHLRGLERRDIGLREMLQKPWVELVHYLLRGWWIPLRLGNALPSVSSQRPF